MKTFTSSVSPKGQVTIPAEVRDRLGIKPRDQVIFEVVDDEVRLRPPKFSLESAYQSIPALLHPIGDDEDLVRLAKEEHALRAMQKMQQ